MAHRYLYLHLSHLHVQVLRQLQHQYVSFYWDEQFYFTPVLSPSQVHNYSIPINSSITLPFPAVLPLPQTLTLQLWQNHMILFEHLIDISQLKSRSATKKKHQIRQGQVLQFTIYLLQPHQFALSQQFTPTFTQHFLIIHQLAIHETQDNSDTGPSYFVISYDDNGNNNGNKSRIAVPVVNAVATIPLPNKFRFEHIKNGKLKAKSRLYEWQEVRTRQFVVDMVVKEDQGYDMQVSVVWGSNLWRQRPQNSMLLDSIQIMLYDLQFRFQNKVDQAGHKLKVVAGSRAFELNSKLEDSKVTRFARIVYFVAKSQQQQFSIVLEKGSRPVARAIVFTQQLMSYRINILKRKLLDLAGRPVGSVRMKCQKAKNLSLPHNNPFWKQNIKAGKQGKVVLQFSQISRAGGPSNLCGLIIKTEQDQLTVPGLCDSACFQLQNQIPQAVILPMQREGSIYLKLIDQQSQEVDQFVGIAVLNYGQLRLGLNALTVGFFRQQQRVCSLNLMVNKAVYWMFVKPLPQPQFLQSAFKTALISVVVQTVQLNGYFQTFLYDRKTDLYCIVQVNRIKKVIILQKLNINNNKTVFVNAIGSDQLNFNVQLAESARIKFTLLVSDGGVQQQIYGTLHRRIKILQLGQGPSAFPGQGLANQYGILVGQVYFQVQKGLVNEFQRAPIKKDLNGVINDLAKVNKSIQKIESLKKLNERIKQSPRVPAKKRYQSLVLPEIVDQASLKKKQLAKMLQAKRRLKDRRVSQKLQKINISHTAVEPIRKQVDVRGRVRSQGLRGQTGQVRQQGKLGVMLQAMREQAQQRQSQAYASRVDIAVDHQLQQNEFAQISPLAMTPRHK